MAIMILIQKITCRSDSLKSQAHSYQAHDPMSGPQLPVLQNVSMGGCAQE